MYFRVSFLTLAFFLFFQIISFAEKPLNSKADEIIAEADRLYNFDQLEPAIQKYESAHTLNPQNANLTKKLGNLYLETGDYEKAFKFLNASLSAYPNDSETYVSLAKASVGLNQIDSAETYFKKALELNQDSVEAEYGLALLLENKGNLDEAEKLYRSVVFKSPQHAGAFFQLGAILYRKGDLRNAKQAFERAAIANPKLLSAHYNLGLVSRELGDYETAREEFKKAISLDPNHPAAFYQAAFTYESQGFLDEAEKGYEEAVRLDPGFSDAYERLRIVRNELMNREENIPSRTHEIPLFGGSFGKGGFQPMTPFGETSKFNSKALLFQAGFTVLQQMLNARNQVREN